MRLLGKLACILGIDASWRGFLSSVQYL